MLAQAPASSPGSAARSMHTSAPAPVPASSPAPDRERSVPNPHPERSGCGLVNSDGLPIIPGVFYERHSRGGFEAWHCPNGSAHRRDKQYLCYVGKKRLDGPPEEIAALVKAKAAGKGITL